MDNLKLTLKQFYYRYYNKYICSMFLGNNNIHEAKKQTYILENIIINKAPFKSLKDFKMCLPYNLRNEFDEFISKKNIHSEQILSKKIPTWIHNLIKYNFIDIDELSNFLKHHPCENQIDLMNKLKEKQSDIHLNLLQDILLFQDTMGEIKKEKEYIETLLSDNILNNPLKIIKGSLHNHTLYSDGFLTIEDYMEHGYRNKLEFIGISDHSCFCLSGINQKELIDQSKKIKSLNSRLCGTKFIHGIECEIKNNGELDINEECMEFLDYIIIGVHRFRSLAPLDAHRMMIKAIENPLTDILAHPLARSLNTHPGIRMDPKIIIEACISNNVAIEFNLSEKRLDIPIKFLDYIIDKGGIIVFSPDVHKREHFHRMLIAESLIHKMNLPHHQVLNTYTYNKLIQYFKRIRTLKK